MNDYLRLLVVFFAAVNPAAVATAMVAKGAEHESRVPCVIGAAIAIALFAVAVLVSSSMLDWLQIEPETFRVAAGIVMALGGAYTIWFGRWGIHSDVPGYQTAVFPLALPLLAGPAGLIAALSYSVDDGAGRTLGAVVVSVAIGAMLVAIGPRQAAALDAVARITGGLLVAIAAGLVVSGVRAI